MEEYFKIDMINYFNNKDVEFFLTRPELLRKFLMKTDKIISSLRYKSLGSNIYNFSYETMRSYINVLLKINEVLLNFYEEVDFELINLLLKKSLKTELKLLYCINDPRESELIYREETTLELLLFNERVS
ncbi:hypothetical protein B6U93_04720 [Candidatus Woesearchaeota archaeon ex4484_78]|nr:MAG: hypothetical protein B6U93_04720 [Candidatus Woesearchaeota archaeon ex4484_78]